MIDDSVKKVWVPDVDHGYRLGRIVDIGSDYITVDPFDTPGRSVSAAYDSTYPAEEYDNKHVDDNCALMYLNQANLLNNVKLRYNKDIIYTYVANILIAVNPYKELNSLYSLDTIKRYQGKSLGTVEPHVYAIGDKAYRDMRALKQSQSIIVSGESGAGKTESAKYLLRYLTESYGAKSGLVETRINESNPLLEAFGNAKTTRNNNSSRFGKFTELHFNEQHRVAGGYISHYLLEKSRICVQSEEERNYHIFYRLCAGAPDKLKNELYLGSPDNYHYLNRGCTQYFCSTSSEKSMQQSRKSQSHVKKGPLKDMQLDDVQDFTECNEALDQIGLNPDEKLNIFKTVATVLHIGNIDFEDDPSSSKGGCKVSKTGRNPLQICCKMLGLDEAELENAFVNRVMQAKGGKTGTAIMVPLKVSEAQNARDALAKAIYVKLFDYIVACINKAIPFTKSANFIGILDIAGFEYFAVNSFEQFCINYCNEKLQQFFNERILKEEQNLYDKEGLGLKKISFVDNQDCIDLIETKTTGIFDLLDEESKLPTPTSDHFTMEVHKKNKNHFRLDIPRKSKLKSHREIRDDEGFLIKHFAGGVVYTTSQFIEKNNDALHASLACLIQECKNDFIKNLFADSIEFKQNTGKLKFISVGGKFRTQLVDLLEKLRATGTNFIRCVKPNLKMVPSLFQGGAILSQLQCSGMTCVLDLMQQGFPSRTSFAELYTMYKRYLPPELARLDPRLFCKALFKALNLKDNEFKFGLTKVFFRPGKFAEFDQIMKTDPDNLKVLIGKVKRWLIWSRWKKAMWCALSVIKLKNKILYRRKALIVMQKTTRMWLCKKRYGPRIKGIRRIKTLYKHLEMMEQIIPQLKADRDKLLQQIQSHKKQMGVVIEKIKKTDRISEKDIGKVYNELFTAFDTDLAKLKKLLDQQKNKEEQDRLKKIQEEIELAKQQKMEEEGLKKLEDEQRKQRIEIEVRRKTEEELERKKMGKDSGKLQAELQAKKDADEEKQFRLTEQDKLDYDLAMRLAPETNGEVDPVVSLKRENLKTAGNKKHDLSKWKYAELRDAINTSCDVELLEACREEFHRRLKVYHAWKTKNNKQSDSKSNEVDERAPQVVVDNAAQQQQDTQKPAKVSQKKSSKFGDLAEQRYFRIPYVPPSEQNRDAKKHKKGWWYAHFDGKWIARQMEVHQDKEPILMLAGVDDMNMCELSLDEAGLTKKKGAEILEADFEDEWNKNGGREYLKNNFGQISSKYVLNSIQSGFGK